MSPPSDTPLRINGLNIGGMVCKCLGTIFCITAIGLKDGPCENSENFQPSCDAALGMGAMAIIADIIATPLTYCGAASYMNQRHSTGIKGMMIASWIIYGIQILNGVGMIGMAVAEDEDVPTGWIVFYLFWTIIGWTFMLIHAEKARKSPPVSVVPVPPQSRNLSSLQALPVGWSEAITENGQKYYYNISTGDASWEFPTTPPPPPPAMSGSSPAANV